MPDDAYPEPLDEGAVATPARGVPAAPIAPFVLPGADAAHSAETTVLPAVPATPDGARADGEPGPPQDAWVTTVVASRTWVRALKPAALSAGVAYGSALVVSFVAVAFTLLAAGDGNDGGDVDASGDASSTFGVLLRLPFLLVSTALFGRTTASVDAGFAGGGATLFLVPLTITVAALAALWLVTALRSPLGSVRERWQSALWTGAVLGIGAALVALLAGVRWSASSELLQADARLGVGAWGTLAGGFVVGALGSALGHAFSRHGVGWARIGLTVPAPYVRSLRALVIGATPVSLAAFVVVGLVGIVKIGFAQTVALALAFAPNALAVGFTLGGFGGIATSGGDSSETATLFSGVPGWWLLLVLLPVLTVVLAGVVGRLEGERQGWRDSWQTPVVAAVLALVAIFVTQVSITLGGSGAFGGGGIGAGAHLAWWTVPLAAAWGFLVEVFERLGASWLIGLVPGLAPAYARVVGAVPGAGTPGTGTPEGGPVGPSAPRPAPTPIDRRRARIALAVVGGVVVLVVGAAIARSVVGNALYSPDKPVEAYLDKLESGDVEGAFALADPDVSNADRGLLTNEVYGAVEARPTDAKVTDVDVDGDHATVTVSAKQDGRTVTQTYDVVKNGHAGLVFDKWELVAPDVPTVDLYGVLPYDAEGFTVNGQPIDGTGELVALPGRYTIALPVDDDHTGLVESGEVAVTVYPDGSTDSDVAEPLQYALTSEATAAARDDAAQVVDGTCLGQEVLEIDECGLNVYEWREDEAKNIVWTPQGEPTVETELTDDGTIVAHVTGDATVSYDLPKADYYDAESPTSDQQYDFWVTYDAQGGELVRGAVGPYRY